MKYLIWRIRCAYWYQRLLDCGPGFAWELSGATLEQQRDMQGHDSEPLDSPRDAVLEELSCWGG